MVLVFNRDDADHFSPVGVRAVAKAVHLAGHDHDGVAGVDGDFLFRFVEVGQFPFQDEDLMFVGVLMVGGMAGRFEFEEAGGEIGGGVIGSEDDPVGDFVGAFFLYGEQRDIIDFL